MKTTITQTQLKEVLKYNEKTGVFNWKKRSGKKKAEKYYGFHKNHGKKIRQMKKRLNKW